MSSTKEVSWSDIIEAIKDTTEALIEEARELNEWAQKLEWDPIAQSLRAQGYSEEDIKLERKLFDHIIRMSERLAK